MSLIHPKTNTYTFKFEPFLKQEYQLTRDPDRPICPDYDPKMGIQTCPRGQSCPYKHILQNFRNKIVCKHWLRGLCKKNDQCEYLHEYNLRKMPECVFYSKNGFCTQTPECQYLHIDPQAKIPRCTDYDRGFCVDGPDCKKRHIKKSICQRYITGFCPLGLSCDLEHPKFGPEVFLQDSLMQRYKIRKDHEINTRKLDEEKERRLNAIINGEIET
ncbi:similar to Saccharomyces cerevisiae YPR107C YTH1 Essential RNA-binding component of cleavage and polyadenylation factor, contains five zinc fingers [Maudiozyma saulgeensis]|uniref:mRNA 3'-end-processing protein n=1 Tax=Maudiozyma saulgeensis TaxID=1789683 RepID=A0A1X7QXU0_9SACH|nr:similar to Saccharomyces cerevisiae YPR107C YTH1 Essential RNA-binding component of cleavage and polyadenylation factor, contains five zinc fingers [Kazachstania saulgeensis]